jgi:phage terminase large subunit
MCNYYDNPLFPEVLEKERQKDYEILPRALYDHIWLGRFNDTVADAIIDPEWFDAAVDAHEKLGWEPIGPIVAIHDPSDLGEDAKGFVVKHGNLVMNAVSRDFQDVNQGADWATTLARECKADHFIWDCDGMGVSLRRQIHASLDSIVEDFTEFHGSGAVERPGETYEGPGQSMKSIGRRLNKNIFINKRAQCYWRLRDRFLNTYMAVHHGKYIDPDQMISISSGCRNIELLRSEICRIPRKFNGKGMIQIMNKREMAMLKIMSPNLADCCMMGESDYEPALAAKDLVFESLF